MIFHSIKWRILAWNYALLAIVVTVLLAAFYRHERENRLQMADVRLRQVLVGALPGFHTLAPGFGPPPDGPRPPPQPPTSSLREHEAPSGPPPP